MIGSVLTIGAVLTVILVIVGIVLAKTTPVKSYAAYFPGFIFFAAGLILLLFATLVDRTFIMGAGLGGWGLACLFSAVISLVVTVIFDTYRQPTTNA